MSKSRTNYKDEVGSTATLAAAGIGAAYLLPFGVFESLRESLKHARHAGKTIYDAAAGGPEGERAAKNLQKALEIVEAARKKNAEAGNVLQNYTIERKELVGELVDIYKTNETVSRVAERLQLQLEGTLTNFFEIGNELKPRVFERIDDTIMELYGIDPIEAREKSGRLKEFYKNVGEFYDSREKNEHTVKEFCNYLAKVRAESERKNEELNELFPSVIGRVREGYQLEDILIETGEENIFGIRKDVSREELKQSDEKVAEYEGKVDETYSTISEKVPIEPYSRYTWIDAINPVTVGLFGAFAVKGVTKLLPRFIESPLTKTLALPFNLAYFGAKQGVKGIRKGFKGAKYLAGKMKKKEKTKNPGDDKKT